MKRLLGIIALLAAFALPSIAQVARMSPQDQDTFNGAYARWVQDKQNNNRDDMITMEQTMQDLMSKYQIPSSTPYDVVAAQNAPPPPRYDRDRDEDRRERAEERYERGRWSGGMSPEDQDKFNKEYSKWRDASSKGDQDDIDKHAREMQKIMLRNNIPADTPFEAVASSNGYASRRDYREFRGKFTEDDQKKFDKAYEHWLNDRRRNDRDDIAKDEGKMQEIMARYNIPRDVPYEMLASGGRGSSAIRRESLYGPCVTGNTAVCRRCRRMELRAGISATASACTT